MRRAAIFILWFTANLALAQDVAGNWVAIPANSGALRHLDRFLLKISRDREGTLSASVYAGSFGDQLFLCHTVRFAEGKLTLTMESAGSSGARDMGTFGRVLSFGGVMSSDGKSIAGWIDGPGLHEKLTFRRTGRAPGTATAAEKTSAPAASPDGGAEASAVLSRALAKLADTHRQLRKYTCLETVDRFYYAIPATKTGRDVMTEAPSSSCNGREFGAARLTLAAEDRLRLEVAVADGKEIDSWASANSFDSRSIYDVVPTGPTNTGAFGTALVGIFGNPAAHFHFAGKQTVDGRELFRYSFDIPLDASSYRVGTDSGWKMTGYHGVFDIDPATAELVRLLTETADLPSEARACRYRTFTEYHYQPIGDGQYLIPLKSDFDVLLPAGNEDHSAIVFSGCHEYGAESSLLLGAETSIPAAGSEPKSAPPIPAGLSLALVLTSPIDTLTAAAGDAISAKVARPVRAPNSDKVAVSAGAIAHGRILQMRHDLASGQFRIAIRFDTLEENGTIAPLAVQLEREVKAARAPAGKGFASRGTEFALPPATPASEPGAWFALTAVDGRAVMAAGSETKWITVAP